jgi:hypothetical protein
VAIQAMEHAQWVLQVMFPSVCSFSVIFICLKDSASLLFSAFFHVVTLCMFPFVFFYAVFLRYFCCFLACVCLFALSLLFVCIVLYYEARFKQYCAGEIRKPKRSAMYAKC